MQNRNIDTITVKAFTHIFSEIVNGNQRFCFILGSGASREAGILTGKEMTKIWISELETKYEEKELKQLMEKIGVDNLEALSENYFSIYDLRFYPEYRHGQAFLEQELEKGRPSVGHYVLAKILTDESNNIAITTNFDSLIEDAIFMYTDKKAILVGHEALSQFVNINIRKPIVAKIHRSLYYNPLNRKNELVGLKEEWKEMLKQIFWVYTPVIIGYAGGDQSLMEFLKEDDVKFNGMYWCYWEKEKPSEEILKLVKEKKGCLVPISGFDQLMHSLSLGIGMDEPSGEIRPVDMNLVRGYHSLSTNSGNEIWGNNKLPELITFFEMYDIEHPEDLHVQKRWSQNEAHRSLAVPIGVRGISDNVELNLHEKAHGPHGLIAGTMGSGKSELMQSYILSMAVNFHPHEIGFLLIDYKGAGFAVLFRNLPHLLGSLTNLYDPECFRVISSLKGELQRRQRIFSDHNVNHIDRYNKLFRKGMVKEPLPHLFIIIDEFAELKSQQPEFMAELVSIARIGRSLGFHLILATQKPSGVVDAQIWSNSKFKICLKVSTESDSREMLKTEVAAYITRLGRAYLQVGANELFEKLQSAWSGATYREHESQADAVIAHIENIYKEMNVIEVKDILLPPLGEMIVSPYTQRVKDNSDFETLDITLALGIVDMPEKQMQREYELNFTNNSHILYVAAAGYGKSVFLGNIIIGLAMKNSSENLNIHILDLGYALAPYKELPHVVDYIGYDINEKMDAFQEFILEMITERNKALEETQVKNFTDYNQTENEKWKAILIVVDNCNAISELESKMHSLFQLVAREGASLGIYLAVTMSDESAIRRTLESSFKERIAGFSPDENYSFVGRSFLSIPNDIRGRALVRTDDVYLMQLYTPVTCENELVYNEELEKLIKNVVAVNTKRY